MRTLLNLLTQGFDSKFFVVSGNGAVHSEKTCDNLYRLIEDVGLNNALISVKIPKICLK